MRLSFSAEEVLFGVVVHKTKLYRRAGSVDLTALRATPEHALQHVYRPSSLVPAVRPEERDTCGHVLTMSVN